MSFCVAGVALRDMPQCFMTCQAFATFSADALHSSWQALHFGDLHRHFAGRAQHLRRVVLRVFCESHCQGCATW